MFVAAAPPVLCTATAYVSVSPVNAGSGESVMLMPMPGAGGEYPTAAKASIMPYPESRSTPVASMSRAVVVMASRISAGELSPR